VLDDLSSACPQTSSFGGCRSPVSFLSCAHRNRAFPDRARRASEPNARGPHPPVGRGDGRFPRRAPGRCRLAPSGSFCRSGPTRQQSAERRALEGADPVINPPETNRKLKLLAGPCPEFRVGRRAAPVRCFRAARSPAPPTPPPTSTRYAWTPSSKALAAMGEAARSGRRRTCRRTMERGFPNDPSRRSGPPTNHLRNYTSWSPPTQSRPAHQSTPHRGGGGSVLP